MKVTEVLIDQILEQGENGSLDPSPYMESLKYLLMEDDEIDLTEDHAYLIFLGTIIMESLKRTGLYKEIEDDEYLFDMEDSNWDALETADGDLDAFITAISEAYPEMDLLDFVAFSILPVDDEEDEDDEPVMSSEDGQLLGFMRLKAMMDAVLLPKV